MRFRTGRRVGPAVLVIILGVVLLLLARWPVPYFVILPGVTADVGNLVSVAGHPNPVRGRFLLVAVDVLQPNVLSYPYYRLTGAELVPAADMLPHGSFADYLKLSEAQMEESQQDAAVAALTAAGYRLSGLSKGVRVVAVFPRSPASGRLKVGDVIEKLNGQTVSEASQVQRLVAGLPVGHRVTLLLRRGRNQETVSLRTVPNIMDPHLSMVGMAILTDWSLPVRIRIRAGDISGPSAGLVFSLQILSQLTGRDLTHGRWVAGTGTISSDGTVGSIGGIRQKVVTAARAGARIFLVPRDNYAAAARTVALDHLHLTLIPVGHLATAVRDLERSA